jgi:hypothetical protein
MLWGPERSFLYGYTSCLPHTSSSCLQQASLPYSQSRDTAPLNTEAHDAPCVCVDVCRRVQAASERAWHRRRVAHEMARVVMTVGEQRKELTAAMHALEQELGPEVGTVTHHTPHISPYAPNP